MSDPETVLIVDDEEPVRRTFREWLEGAALGCRVLVAGDAASALALADKHPIDLAVLDWNLGAGHDGLQLLEDLTHFNPDVVAILVTGFANQATPLMAMRMGVRDYLDKNQDLTRDAFLRAVNKQLDRVRPARREKRVNHGLAAFRAAVERVLPLVQTTTALNDPVPITVAVRSLLEFLLEATEAKDGVLLVYAYDESRQPPQTLRAFAKTGQPLDGPLAPFSRSLAGGVAGLGEPRSVDRPDDLEQDGTVELHSFERGRANLLAAPISVKPGMQVVVELLDKPGPFTQQDRRLMRAASAFGGDLIRQALAEHQTRRVLFDAVAAALKVGDDVARTLGTPQSRAAPYVMEQLRSSLGDSPNAEATLRLAEAVRVLAIRYGPRALDHCIRLVEDLRGLLDELTGETPQ